MREEGVEQKEEQRGHDWYRLTARDDGNEQKYEVARNTRVGRNVETESTKTRTRGVKEIVILRHHWRWLMCGDEDSKQKTRWEKAIQRPKQRKKHKGWNKKDEDTQTSLVLDCGCEFEEEDEHEYGY